MMEASSSVVFGNLWKMFRKVRPAFGNLRKVIESLRKIVKNATRWLEGINITCENNMLLHT